MVDPDDVTATTQTAGRRVKIPFLSQNGNVLPVSEEGEFCELGAWIAVAVAG